MQEFIEIDASAGGQVFRTAIGLSALTQKPVHLSNIRSARPNPGLQAQHLTALQVVARLCNAQLKGAKKKSTELFFTPHAVVGGAFAANIGTAGSISLVLQSAIFPSLLKETKLRIIGGTNVPFSPPIEFLQESLFPVLKKMGCNFDANVNKRGYFPRGNGIVSFSSKQAKLHLSPICFNDLGELKFITAFSNSAGLPKEVCGNQLRGAKKELESLNVDFVESLDCKEESDSTGSCISLFAHFSSGRVLAASALGAKGKQAIFVGKEAAEKLKKEISACKAVDAHLADQLLPFMALAEGYSTIETSCLTEHALNNIKVCEQLLECKFETKGKLNEPAEIFVQGIGFTGAKKTTQQGLETSLQKHCQGK